jgi:redox-sensing transcriptional repressor
MNDEAKAVSEKTIGRLSLYRRVLDQLLAEGTRTLFSHQLATLSGCTASQIRRDLMAVGYSGTPSRGYEVPSLLKSIREFLDAPTGQRVALVGVGNLGKALLSYFSGRRPGLQIVAAFDSDPYKVNRVIHGCKCYAMTSLAEEMKAQKIRVVIVTVPAGSAQEVAEQAVKAGAKGVLNFAPIRLKTPPNVYIEDMDMTMALEKVAWFARQKGAPKEEAAVATAAGTSA